MSMAMLEGKAVVITGSGRGIGAACARGVAAQGAAVVVNDVDTDVAEAVAETIARSGGRAVPCPADITDWNEAGRLIDSCLAAFGRIDGLVNNAALFHMAPVTAIDPARARALVDVNVLGPLHCTGHAVKPMVAQGSGAIVNVVSGAQMGMANLGIYGATKGAAASLVYTWAIELAGTGVRVNGLSPFGATRMTEIDEGVLDAETLGRQIAELPPPEQNSPVVEYLLSDRATAVNGQLVRIDKGELQLYTHPALLVPPVVHPAWTAEAVADAFDADLAQRQVGCGVLGMRAGPEPLTSGYWARTAD
jgi:NAD(P)-dependent dehydrogenase (short-subunit alcohol dehydrogenase family)